MSLYIQPCVKTKMNKVFDVYCELVDAFEKANHKSMVELDIDDTFVLYIMPESTSIVMHNKVTNRTVDGTYYLDSFGFLHMIDKYLHMTIPQPYGYRKES